MIDLPVRRMEREERLLAMPRGNVNETLQWMFLTGEFGKEDARFLLAHGAYANQSFDGMSMLTRAAYCGDLGVVEALLDAGARQLWDALRHAAHGGHTAVVALLLDRGADVHFENGDSLRCASRQGHLEVATVLPPGPRR